MGVGRAPSAAERSLPRASVVYLSADAAETLSEPQPFPAAVYVIGGLVDRNRHKGAGAARAAALGVRCARLPIAESTTNGARVLTTLHVAALLGEFWRTRDWARACEAVLPARKAAGRRGAGGAGARGGAAGAAAAAGAAGAAGGGGREGAAEAGAPGHVDDAAEADDGPEADVDAADD